MLTKINTIDIIKDHINTLTNNEKVSAFDIFIFYIAPAGLGVATYLFKMELNQASVSTLVTVGSIFTGLLLSLMILVYDQRSKLSDQHSDTATRLKTALLQLLNNISYCILISVLLVITAFIQQLSSDSTIIKPTINSVLISISLHLALTILMVLKRVNIAVTARF